MVIVVEGDGSLPSDLLSAVDAKRALLAACDGNRDEAIRLWGGRGSEPISRADMEGLLAECEITDAEVVDEEDPGRPF
jgi:hypothetical protein